MTTHFSTRLHRSRNATGAPRFCSPMSRCLARLLTSIVLVLLVLAACASTASSTDRHVVFESHRFT